MNPSRQIQPRSHFVCHRQIVAGAVQVITASLYDMAFAMRNHCLTVGLYNWEPYEINITWLVLSIQFGLLATKRLSSCYLARICVDWFTGGPSSHSLYCFQTRHWHWAGHIDDELQAINRTSQRNVFIPGNYIHLDQIGNGNSSLF